MRFREIAWLPLVNLTWPVEPQFLQLLHLWGWGSFDQALCTSFSFSPPRPPPKLRHLWEHSHFRTRGVGSCEKI